MSVSYYLNKGVTLKDLKDIGLTVIDLRKEHPDYCPFGITNELGDGVGVTEIDTDGSDCEDDYVASEFEGRFSTGGATVILEICDKLDRKFITDEDLEITYNEGKKITEETFNERTEKFRKMLTDESE
jgi:hypothetical protein